MKNLFHLSSDLDDVAYNLRSTRNFIQYVGMLDPVARRDIGYLDDCGEKVTFFDTAINVVLNSIAKAEKDIAEVVNALDGVGKRKKPATETD